MENNPTPAVSDIARYMLSVFFSTLQNSLDVVFPTTLLLWYKTTKMFILMLLEETFLNQPAIMDYSPFNEEPRL